MASISTILVRCLIGTSAIIFLLALMYLIPALVVHRFCNIHTVFTVNLCFAIAFCDLYWFSYSIILDFFPSVIRGPSSCLVHNYFSMMCNMQVPLAVLTVSIHRLCSVVYYAKPFFKKKKWAVLCISCQWTAGIIFALPQLSSCQQSFWSGIYTLLMVVIIPSFICLIIHLIIFKHIRSSRHRVQPSVATANNDQTRLSRRDIHLLRHMIVMFVIFVGGWSPVYLYPLIVVMRYPATIFYILIILASLSLLFDVVNLFLYNHELRQYVLQKIFRC